MWWIIFVVIAILFILLLCLFNKQIRVFYIGLTKHRRIQKNLYQACKSQNYLIINDILIQVNEEKFRHVDTIIIGNKFVYVVKEAIWLGKIEGFRQDEKWRLYYKNTLDHVRNPFIENEKKMNRIAKVLPLPVDRFINIVVLADSVQMDHLDLNNENEFLCKEEEVILTINWIEKNSSKTSWSNQEVEQMANLLYEHGLNSEKLLKNKKSRGKKNEAS